MKLLLKLVLLVLFEISFLTVNAHQDTVIFSKRIAVAIDDVEESQNGSFIYTTSSDLELVYDTYSSQGNQVVGMRFTGIDVPAGAEIISAYLQFTVDAVSTSPTNLIIIGELSSHSQSFSTAPFNVSSRQPTAAQVSWANIPVWANVGASGPDQRTPDLGSVISEIIHHQDWASGNAITLIVRGTGTREAVAFDGSPQGSPILVIAYAIETFSNDLSLKRIINPADIVSPSAFSQVQVSIRNAGFSPQNNFEVFYALNHAIPVIEAISGITIIPGDSLVYTFNTPMDLSVTGEYDFEAGVILADDENIQNDVLQKTFIVEMARVENIHWGSTNNTLNGLTVSWKSPGDSDSLAWGYNDLYLNGKFLAMKHSGYADNFFDFTFPDVQSSSEIHYSIYNSSAHGWTNDQVFFTSVDTAQNHFSFTVAGDCRTYLNNWKSVADAMPHKDFTMFAGDMVENGSLGNLWDDFMDYGKNQIQNNLMFYQYGNHDVGANNYENIFVLPQNPTSTEFYYSFTFGNALFISLNCQNAGDETQYNWLINTLESHQDKVWKLVFMHKPFYSCGGHQNEMDNYFGTWWKAFDDYGVDLIFTGHAHNYQRTKPINRNVSTTGPVQEYGSLPGQGRCQIISGGAGAPLHNVYPNQWFADAQAILNYGIVEINQNVLSFKAFNIFQQEIDSLTLNKDYYSYHIPAGWSGFSTFQDVINPNVVDMFEPVAENLVLLNDFDHVYWPGTNTNSFTDWETKSGAKIKLAQADTLIINGSPTNDRQIYLNLDWQFLPVLAPCNLNLTDIFGLISNKVKVIKEIAGTGVYWPEFNISTLSVLEAGKAYLLKMNEPATIEYPLCLPSWAPNTVEHKNQVFDSFWKTPHCSGTSHLIGVPVNEASKIFSEGDIIGVFTPEEFCAGQAIFDAKNLAIVAFADDPATAERDGFIEGEPLIFRVFRPSTNQILNLEVSFNPDYGDSGLFVPEGISVISKFKSGAANDAFQPSERTIIFPNPAKNVVYISGISKAAKLEIIPVTGAESYKNVAISDGTVMTSQLKQGVYIFQITDETIVIHKIVIIE
jgi:hypothetical protein